MRGMISKELTGSDLILAGRTYKGCLMRVGGVGVGGGGVVGQMEPLEHNTAHTKRPRNLRAGPPPPMQTQTLVEKQHLEHTCMNGRGCTHTNTD